jgi:hypothetical protein
MGYHERTYRLRNREYPAIERTVIRTIAHQNLGHRVKPKAEVLQELFSDLLVRSERERQP